MEFKKVVYNCCDCFRYHSSSKTIKAISMGENHELIEYYCEACYEKNYGKLEEKENEKSVEKNVTKTAKCDSCFQEANIDQLKKLSIITNTSELIHYMICEICWFTDLEDIINTNPIAKAASLGKPEIVKILLKDYRLDPDERYRNNGSALYHMCLYGNIEVVKILLNHNRVNPEKLDMDHINNIYINGHLKIIEMLLWDGRFDPTKLGKKLWKVLREINDDKLTHKVIMDERVDITKI